MAVRVLLVDDAVDMRRLLRTALRFHGGFEVAGEAGNGTEAVALAGSRRPDVVVLDLGLPDLAGREVLTGIRARSPGTKVVVFSGGNAPDHDWIVRHVDGYVLKDAELDYLVDLLESVGRAGEAEASVDLPYGVTSVAAARRFVEEQIREWHVEQLCDDALLIASELTTNAITHAHSACRLHLSLTSSSLRIDVADSGAGTPEPQQASQTREHGRGLHLVAALTTAWGLEARPDGGKLVWAELARS